VMPHVVYLHSALTQDRIRPQNSDERRLLVRFQRVDVAIAMTLAGLVNAAMLVVAAGLLHGSGHADVESLEGAHEALGSIAGQGAAVAFGLALLASGFASSSVGTYAGQVVMQGFIRRRIPLALRRLVTMAPALVILGAGVDPTQALVLSQVALSFGIPFALVPLVLLTRRPEVMGEFANRRATTAVAALIAALVIALNVVLLASLLTG
jgi:manganese transport protein